MNKLTIYATGNERITGDYNVSYYVIEKNKMFLEWLGILLEEVLGIENGKHKAMFIDRFVDDGPIEIIQKRISKMKDLHEKYINKGERVDVFYGDKRVYVTFRKSREVREKFVNFVQKHSDWVKIEEMPMESLGAFRQRETQA